MSGGKEHCCPAFERRVENAGKRGLAFLVSKNSRGYFWVIQSRGVDHKSETLLNEPSVDINVASEIAMKFCPFCGSSLANGDDAWMAKYSVMHSDVLGLPQVKSIVR